MPSDIKQCPYCAEDIKAAAIVCKHCGRELPEFVSTTDQGQFHQHGASPSLNRRNRVLIYLVPGLIFLAFLVFLFTRIPQDLTTQDNPESEATIESIFSQASTQQAQLTDETEPTELPTTAPILVPPTLVPTGIAEVVIPASEAHEYEGQSITVEIPKAYCSYRPTTNGEPTFCNDQPFPGNNFTLLVWGEDWSHFDGQCIWVTGTVELFEGKSEIVADTPSQVSLCP